MAHLYIYIPVPRLASAVTLDRARACGTGPPRTIQQHSNLPDLGHYRTRVVRATMDRSTTQQLAQFRALPDPGDEGHGVGRGGGGDTDGDRRQEADKKAGASGMRTREHPQNYSSVRREGGGIRTVVRGKGEGGRGQRETGTKRKIRRGTKSVGNSRQA